MSRWEQTVGGWWQQREPTEREQRAAAWERRRRELLPAWPGHDYYRSSRRAVAVQLGLSDRTLKRYEYDGAPAWYELALIGLAHARRRAAPPDPTPH